MSGTGMLPKEFGVKDKTVIVTGAARGIGKGIARVLAHSGAKVMVTALTDRYLKPLADGMNAAGYPMLAMTADATRHRRLAAPRLTTRSRNGVTSTS